MTNQRYSCGVTPFCSHASSAEAQEHNRKHKYSQRTAEQEQERRNSIVRIARQSEELGEYDKFVSPEEKKMNNLDQIADIVLMLSLIHI